MINVSQDSFKYQYLEKTKCIILNLKEQVPDQLCHLEKPNKIIVHPLVEASLLNQRTFCNQSPY